MPGGLPGERRDEDASPPAGKVCWLASYPKSGNTWLRYILNEIFGYDDEGKSRVISFLKAYPANAPLVSLRGQQSKLLKTHLHPVHQRMSLVPDESIAAILIRRHPLDILLSALNYAKLRDQSKFFLKGNVKSVEAIIADGEFPHYIDLFSRNDGFPLFSGSSGAMSKYLGRWRQLGVKVPILELRYEDFTADPKSGLREVAAFLQIDLSCAEIKRIVETVDQMTQKNDRFFWKRRAYNFTHMLPQELVELFTDTCKPQLAGFGY
ncbi:hypothetical protein ATO6_22635 [Oceanicola sp. 22II-s10i]|uniref:sulfotransferase domain-containing protein n=1 Tax=Oceanicola sp. 22II-s10i TaxID=1317116 RepID=UPI000B524014|nr:sulfotransferase domain-containing protein [Oceanicola sp. 22II-s10i]OWU82245.1 hypothetical protein ATO6_22635 [Oceanicola sp. 22II-s10i]